MKLSKSCAVAIAILSPALLVAGTTFYASPSVEDAEKDCLTPETAGDLKCAIDKMLATQDNTSEVVLLPGIYDCTGYGTNKISTTESQTRWWICFSNNEEKCNQSPLVYRESGGRYA